MLFILNVQNNQHTFLQIYVQFNQQKNHQGFQFRDGWEQNANLRLKLRDDWIAKLTI